MKKKKFMKLLISITMAFLLSSIGTTYAKGPASGPGHVLIGVDASTWTSGAPTGDGLIPILGSGQVNGDFTVAERNGIQIGLRAQERLVGPIMAVPNNNKIGIYEAATGFSISPSGSCSDPVCATWNYDWHVDLRYAHGVAAGTTLDDYDLTLATDIADTTLFGLPLPLNLVGGLFPPDIVLYQSSQNPKFGNPPFDAAAADTYTFTLVLTPKSFKGPPLKVSIQVNVN